MHSLVSTQWLAERLDDPAILVLDASYHLPGAKRDAEAEFAQTHIANARFLDLKTLTNPDDPVPSAPPTRAQLDDRLAMLGLRHDQRVVLYDNSALHSSARAWFLLRLHGITNVSILDGGLPRWQAEGGAVESGLPACSRSDFSSAGKAGELRYKADLLANIDSRAEQVVDARDNARFRGDSPDIRPGVQSGHIPGSRNLPFGELLREDGTFKDEEGLRAAFVAAGVDLDRPIVTSCGSGVTASVLLFALHLLGKDAVLYDGSWSDWGSDPDMPVATGPAI